MNTKGQCRRDDFKHQLNQLIFMTIGRGDGEWEMQDIRPRRRLGRKEERRLEFKAWNTYFTYLNSPYVVSVGNFTWPEGNQYNKVNIWNDVMVEAYQLKAQRKEQQGKRIEELVDKLKGSATEPNIIRFLLCMAWTDRRSRLSSSGLDRSYYSLPCLQNDVDTENNKTSSNWISNNTNWMQQPKIFISDGFFQTNQTNPTSIFSSQPGSHFSWNRLASPVIKDETAEISLFGALSQSHTSSMDMSLEIPMLSENHAPLSFGSDRKVQENSEDEGFIEDLTTSTLSVEDHSEYKPSLFAQLEIWTKAANCDQTKRYTWETLGRYDVMQDLEYLTESGSAAFDHLCDVRQFEVARLAGADPLQTLYYSQGDFIRHSMNVLIGLSSHVFIFKKANCSFSVDPRVRMSGVSPEGLQKLLMNFAKIGSYYKQLNAFLDHHSQKLSGVSGGLTLEAFVDSLRTHMYTYKCAVMKIEDHHGLTLIKLWTILQKIGMQLRFLADICLCSVAFGRDRHKPKPQFPVGLRLLSYLLDLCRKNRCTANYPLLLHLYRGTAAPFLRFISDWILDGSCRDVYGEFLIDVDDHFLCYRDKHYWTHGFTEKPNRADICQTMFRGDIFQQIFACGKTINLLKTTCPEHYLLKKNLSPANITIKLSMRQLENVKKESKDYMKRVALAYEAEKERKRLLLAKQMELKQEKTAVERKIAEKYLEHINELERKVKQAMQQKKDNEFKFLKSQMEEAIEGRKIAQRQQMERDVEFIKKAEMAEAEEVDKFKEEREKLISYYEEMTQMAAKRESCAMWSVRRYEMRQKRRVFLEYDRKLIDGEMVKFQSENIDENNSAMKTNDDTTLRTSETSDVANAIADPTTRLAEGSVEEESKTKARLTAENTPAAEDPRFHEMVDDFKTRLQHAALSSDENARDFAKEDFAISKKGVDDDNLQGSTDGSSLQEGNHPADQKEVNQNKSEGKEAKSLLYPNSQFSEIREDRTAEQRALWDIEAPKTEKQESTLQTVLYPGNYEESSENTVLSPKLTRGQEPVSTMKQLLYGVQGEAFSEESVEWPTPVTDAELWLDISADSLEDNFDAMNSTPDPNLSYGTNDIAVIDRENEEIDAVFNLPIEMILERSLIIPMKAQIQVVQDAIVKYFMEDLKIGDHFDAFRKFLLLEDGEFGRSLCYQLFEKSSTGLAPREFCVPTVLNNMISHALQQSLFADKLTFSRQLTFSLKWVPELLKSTDVAALDFIELRYKVPWPCNIVVTENCITKYNKVFSLLLRLKKVTWTLQSVWANLKMAGHDRRAAMSPQLRLLQLFRYEMQHFVNNVERYIVNQIIHISWQEFQLDLSENVHNLDDLHKVHVNYLNQIIFRSLLSKNATPVFKIISDIFSLILKLHVQLMSSPWTEEDVTGFMTHNAFKAIRVTHNAFQEYAGFLFKVVSKLVRRGYQQHLDDFLLQVNFNGYYQHAII